MVKDFVMYLYRRFKTNKTYEYCRRCGKKLKTRESKKLGLGSCCYKKEVKTKYTKPLF